MAPSPSPPTSLHDLATTHHTNSQSTQPNLNPPVPAPPYYIPQHRVSPGVPFPTKAPIPTLFKPLTIRSLTIKNRIVVSPMCQYSCAATGPTTGALTPYHVATLGHYALKGAGLVFIEASAVQPCGRISPNDAGLWSDSQIEGIRAVADIVHAQGALLGIQLAHAGRKASAAAPWVGAGADGRRKNGMRATRDVGGWGPGGVVGPIGGKDQVWDGRGEDDGEGGYWEPRGLTLDEITELVGDWKTAAVRAVRAGVDVIEVHGAHGVFDSSVLEPCDEPEG